MSLVDVKSLVKVYKDGELDVSVLSGVDLAVEAGDFVSVRGESGAGKSTLLNVLGALDAFDSGDVVIAGIDLQKLPRKRFYAFRRDHIGFIFQHHYLLPEFTITENVMMPLLMTHVPSSQAREQAQETLSTVGLGHRLEHYPSQISGGESQRVAVARAITHKPPLILADEPTGNLDSNNTRKFVDILARLQEDYNLTVLVVTHDEALAGAASSQYEMVDGQIQ